MSNEKIDVPTTITIRLNEDNSMRLTRLADSVLDTSKTEVILEAVKMVSDLADVLKDIFREDPRLLESLESVLSQSHLSDEENRRAKISDAAYKVLVGLVKAGLFAPTRRLQLAHKLLQHPRQAFMQSAIEETIKTAEAGRRLVLIVGPYGSGKTDVLEALHSKTNAPIVDLRLELSEDLASLAEEQQCSRIASVLKDMIEASETNLVLIDNAESLFDSAPEINPLKLLYDLANDRTIAAAVQGSVSHGRIVAGAKQAKYPIRGMGGADFVIVGPGETYYAIEAKARANRIQRSSRSQHAGSTEERGY